MRDFIDFVVAHPVWAIVGVMVIAIIVIITWPTPLPVVLEQGNDISISAKELCVNVQPWTRRLYGQLEPSSWLTASCLSKENKIVINMNEGLPQPDVIASVAFKQLFAPNQDKGTRPLRFLEHALASAKMYPDKLFVVVFFTDGENDYQEDNGALKIVCQNLIDQPNVVRVALLGLDKVDASSGADWSSWFHGSDKAIIATSAIGCTEATIDHLCSDVKEVGRKIAESIQKGR